jgi:Homeodomain-like domain
MRTGISFAVSPTVRRRLRAVIADRNAPQKHVWRAQIGLLSADGAGTNTIMRQTGKSKTCVWRWQQRFMNEGFDGIWRAHGLQPHRVRQFKLSTDPKFVQNLRDVIGLYVDPPAHAIVLSVDEKSQIRALDRTQPGLPMKKGRSCRQSRLRYPGQLRRPQTSQGAVMAHTA